MCEPVYLGCRDKVEDPCALADSLPGFHCEVIHARVPEDAPIGVCVPDSHPRYCGGFTGEACAHGEYCHYDLRAMCGWADAQGECRPTPRICPDVLGPVCGCDGATYGNECEANARGVSIQRNGPCETPHCYSDADCPNGYCEHGDDCPFPGGCTMPVPAPISRCVFPNCGDGTQPICMMMPPNCAAGEVLAVINGCYECRDARTCLEPANCRRTGCSGQLCADRDMHSTCEWLPQYRCYDFGICERQAGGACGWTITPQMSQCLAE